MHARPVDNTKSQKRLEPVSSGINICASRVDMPHQSEQEEAALANSHWLGNEIAC